MSTGELLTTEQVAKKAGVVQRSVLYAIQTKKLTARKLGSRGRAAFAYVIEEDEAARWIKERKEAKK